MFDNETYEQCMNAVDQMRSRNALVIIVTDCKKKIMTYYEKKDKDKGHKEENNIKQNPER